MKHLKVILSILICAAAVIGDYIVFKSKVSNYLAIKAISDSLVHACIGCLSALQFFSYDLNVSNEACIINVIMCTIFSSVIDVDHVFVAKSVYLKDMIGLKQRGIFHCTTFCLLLTVILFIYSYTCKKIKTYLATWMFIMAFTSHHTRDANRRGFYMFPLGHTPALSKFLYILLLEILPHVFSFLYVYMKPVIKYEAVEYIDV